MAYAFYRPITIDHTKVPNTDQVDFPVLISGTYAWLATTGNGGDVTSSSGYDIVFSADAGGSTPLDFERVTYSPATGAVEFWVRVPSVSHTTDTVIYIRYGDAGVTTDQASPADVWDANFKSVHHYGDGATLSAADSTSNARSITTNTATATSGKIDGGAATAGSGSQKITYSDTGLPSGAVARTIEVWLKVSSFGQGSIWAYGTADSPYGRHCGLRFTSDSNLQVVGWGADGNLGESFSADVWYQVVLVYSGSALSLYLDGAITAVNAEALSWDTTLTGTLYVGTQSFAGDIFDGTIDELRFSNVARSADWIAAQFANQSNPSTFYAVGSAVSGGASLEPTGIASTAAFGTPAILSVIAPTGIASTAAFGTPGVTGALVPAGIASTVAFGLAIVTGAIVPSGIASTAAFGTPVVNAGISPTGIASTVAFGTPVFTEPAGIDAEGIASTLQFGSPVVLTSGDRAFTIFIGGVDRTKYISDPSIELTSQLGSRTSCGFKIIPEFSGGTVVSIYTPAVHDEVIIYLNAAGYRLFGGQVESVARSLANGTSDFFTCNIRCTDFGVICDRRAVAKYYSIALGSYAQIIANDLVHYYLQGTGITYNYPQAVGAYIGEQLFNWLLVSEALDQICDAAGLDWLVTKYKELRLIDRTAGSGPAPFSIEQDDGNWRDMTATQTRGKFANRVIVRNFGPAATWYDEHEIDGSYAYPTTYPMETVPTVTVDGEPQVVVSIYDWRSTPGWQWYYIPDGPGIFPNLETSPSSGTLIIEYPSRTSPVAVAENAASIAAVGQFDHIEEMTDIQSDEAMQAHAESLVARMSIIPYSLDIETDRPGLDPGQLLYVNANEVTGNFLIEQVDISEFYQSMPRWRVRASNAALRSGSGVELIRTLIRRTRQPVFVLPSPEGPE